jgi:TolA-binding protein
MQSQEGVSDYIFKVWPWFEANLKRLVYGTALVVIAALLYSFYSYQQNQKELAASQTLTQANLSQSGSEFADVCLKIAANYAGTLAGQRALLEGATTLFVAGKYADAQAAFQKFLDSYPDNFFTPQALLGVAASFDALGNTDLAISSYQKAAGQTVDPNVAANAKFSIARIDEVQGKSAEAARLYAEVARAYARTSLGSEAGLRAMELNAKLNKTPVAAASAASTPFNLSH